MPQAPRIGAVLLLVAAFGAGAASATTMVPESLENLATLSDAVVHATTLDTHAEWRGRMIVTVVHVRVSEALLGRVSAGEQLAVIAPGGTVGDRQLIVDGAPRFAPGEDVVVFLSPARRAGEWVVTDLAQGKFEVSRDAGGRERLTRRDMEGIVLSGRTAVPGSVSLVDLRQRVRSALRLAR